MQCMNIECPQNMLLIRCQKNDCGQILAGREAIYLRHFLDLDTFSDADVARYARHMPLPNICVRRWRSIGLDGNPVRLDFPPSARTGTMPGPFLKELRNDVV
jgi:hypothetical protein